MSDEQRQSYSFTSTKPEIAVLLEEMKEKTGWSYSRTVEALIFKALPGIMKNNKTLADFIIE